jgi:3-oxoadipate enol-lactonase
MTVPLSRAVSDVRTRTVSRSGLEYIDLGSGPALLLVHGSAAASEFWETNLEALARDFRVIAPSLPGFGASPKLASSPHDLGPYADSVAELLRELDVRPVAVGHSLGGLVCVRLATSHPSSVRSLVLVDSGGGAMSRLRLALIVRTLLVLGALFRRPRVIQAILRRAWLRRRLFARALHDPDILSEVVVTSLLHGAAAPGLADAVKAGANEQRNSTHGKVQVPATVIWGRYDRILPLRIGVELAERLPGARLEVVDNAGHAPMLEQPRAFEAALRRAMHAHGARLTRPERSDT